MEILKQLAEVGYKSGIQRMTYGEIQYPMTRLEEKAKGLAKQMKELGIKANQEEKVLILLERSPALVAAHYATFLAGGVIVAVDPKLPNDRLKKIMEDIEPIVIISHREININNNNSDSAVIIVDKNLDCIEGYADRLELEGCEIKSNLAAYIVYTSGTTGHPKGVVIEWSALSHLLEWHLKSFNLTSDSQVSLTASPGFDASVWEIWAALTSCSSIHIAKDDERLVLEGLKDAWIKHGVTHSFVSTPIAERLIDLEWSNESTKLEYLLTGGDRLTKFPPSNLPFKLVNNYGPSEGCVVATSGIVPSQSLGKLPPHIGASLPYVKCFVLDEDLNEVTINQKGTLWIAGAGLAREYLKRPNETKDKFCLIGVNGEKIRAYNTGDLVSKDENGVLHFYGREDSQVNINGVRIELGEIESILQQHSSVSQAVALTIGVGSNTMLAASVVPLQSEECEVKELMNLLKLRLPSSMIPSQIMLHSELPLTQNGKNDRAKLEKEHLEVFFQKQAKENDERIELNGDIKEIISIYLDVLDMPCFANSNLFVLGGNSLDAAQIASRLSKRFHIECRPSHVLQGKTPKGLAELLKTIPSDKKTSRKYDGKLWFPVTPMQQGLWYLWKTNPNNAFYNVGAAFEIEGELNEEAFTQAVNQTLCNHPSLRLTFRENFETNEIEQMIKDVNGIEFWKNNVIRMDVQTLEDALYEINRIFREPFDLDSSACLARSAIISRGKEKTFFLLTAHHIVCDGLSLQNILEEISYNYKNKVNEIQTNLLYQENNYEYLQEYVYDQIEFSSDQELNRFWEKRAKSFSTAEFTVSKHIDKDIHDGAIFECQSEIGLGNDLERYCREMKVSKFVVLLTAWVATIAKFCCQEELTVGVPFHGRSHHTYLNNSGMFVNLVPVTMNLCNGKSFNELVKEADKELQQTLEHGDFSIVEIAKKVRRGGSLDIINTTFSEKVELSLPIESVKATFIELDSGGARFPLSGFFNSQNNRVGGHIEYSSAMFDEHLIEDISKAYFCALAEMIKKPENRWIYSYSEESIYQQDKKSIKAWEEKSVPLHCLFEKAAEEYPDNIAVKDSKYTWTFKELNQKSNIIAAYLQRLGVIKGDYVPLIMERSAEMIAGILAVLKAGAIYVPLDPESPHGRNLKLLNRLDPRVVLSDSYEIVPKGIWNICLLKKCISEESYELRPVDVSVFDGAYLMFTSGTTGEPKGVICPHIGAALRVIWQLNKKHLGPGSKVLIKTPYTFDVSVWEMFYALGSGSTSVIAPPSAHRDPEGIIQLIINESVNLCHFVPSMLQLILDIFETNNSFTEVINLKYIHTSGEVLPEQMAYRLKSYLPNVTLLNLYGPTEAGVEVTCCEVDSHVNIGNLLPYVSASVVDEMGKPVPKGFPGELLLGGLSLALGYFNDEDETNRAFIYNSGERYYRTGDIVRFGHDNSIDFLGRVDSQVKIKGVRIEPSEIEACVAEMNEVQEVAVATGRRENQELALVCFYILKSEKKVTIQEIKEKISHNLPTAYIPSVFVAVDTLPITKSGKRNRKLLKAEANKCLKNISGTRDYKAPVTKTEKMIAYAWGKILKQGRIGVNNNFFELGGDSIKSLQVISELKRAGLKLVPKDFIRYPTVAEQAIKVEEMSFNDEIAVSSTEVSKFKTLDLPLTPLQSVMLMETLKEPESDAYWQVLSYSLSGNVDSEQIKLAWRNTVKANPALRTRFVWKSVAEPKQIIHSETEGIGIKEVNWHHINENWNCIEEWYQNEIDGMKEKLLENIQQTYIIHNWQDSEKILFVWIHHHILLDGWSIAQCLSDFFNVLENPSNELSERPTVEPYFRLINSPKYMDSCLKYWKEILKGIESAETLHLEKKGNIKSKPDFLFLDRRLGERAAVELNRFCTKHKITPSSVIMTLWAILIRRYQSSNKIFIGTTFANRPYQLSNSNNMSGMLINTLPVKIDLQDNVKVVDICKQTMNHISDISEYTGISYSKLLQLAELPGATELFQSTVIFQNFEGELDTNFGHANLQHTLGTSSDPLSITLDVQDDYIMTRLGWDNKRYMKEELIILISALEECLERIEEVGEKNTERFFLTNKEVERLNEALQQSQILDQNQWNFNTIFNNKNRYEEIALADGNREYSYGEVEKSIDRMMAVLRRRGVVQGDTIAFVGKKSAEVAIAIMAAWKLGVSWCAIDSDFPKFRQEKTLKVLKPKIVINLDEVKIEREKESVEELVTAFQFESRDIAYYIATSGSTGEPKIVALEAGGIINVIGAWKQYYKFEEPQNILQLGSWTSDVFLGDLLKAWSTGGTLVVCPDEKRIDMGYLIDITERYNISLIESTPVLVREFVSYANQIHHKFAHLKTLIVGADIFRAEEKLALCNKLGDGISLYNGYGLSECTIESIVYRCEYGEEASRSGLCPIGASLPRTHLRITDKEGRDVPPGVIGELHIGGSQVAKGYLDIEGINQKGFYELEGIRYFRTGDLVRLNGDGNIEFFGRKDQQVKIRGYRVELGDIENALLSLTVVQEAFIATVATNRGTELVGFVSESEKTDEESKMVMLKKLIPQYALPRKIVTLEKLPRNANGKIDRPKLLEEAKAILEQIDESHKFTSLEDTNDLEKTIGQIWERLLGKSVNSKRSFFDQGGHSLLVLEMFNLLKQALPEDEFVIGDLFRYPSVQALASEIELRRKSRDIEKEKRDPLNKKSNRLEVLRRLQKGELSADEAFSLMNNLSR